MYQFVSYIYVWCSLYRIHLTQLIIYLKAHSEMYAFYMVCVFACPTTWVFACTALCFPTSAYMFDSHIKPCSIDDNVSGRTSVDDIPVIADPDYLYFKYIEHIYITSRTIIYRQRSCFFSIVDVYFMKSFFDLQHFQRIRAKLLNVHSKPCYC